jgi:ABC-type Fe3+/spermidine/putrescine transport system ATPase subunit
MSRLRLNHVTRRFEGMVAVDDVSLEVADGEFLTLLGPSGCGKTTTLRMIAGFLAPDAGDIWFDDRRMTGVPPHKRNTAMVFQSYALFPHMTVAENVGFGLLMRKLPRTERAARVAEALDLVSLTGLEGRRPGQLSGGQQQRVALARAIVTRPDILLFDEPLSNLDAKLREKVRVEIRELQRRLKITSIYVTHDQAEALVVSDRIVVMNRGRIEQVGDPDTIYRAPDTAFVADFIGLTNIVEGTVLADGSVETPVGCLRIDGRQAVTAGRIKLIWRPEDMRPSANGRANRLSGTVRQVIFRGNVTEFTFDVNGHSLRGQVDNELRPQEGEAITLDLDADRIRVVA